MDKGPQFPVTLLPLSMRDNTYRGVFHMRILARLAVVTALLLPAGIAASGPATAAAPSASCARTTAQGLLTAAPGFKQLVKKKQDYVLNTADLDCTGGLVRGVNIALNTPEPIAVNCATVIGARSNSGSSHGVLTWTKPAHQGSSKFHAYITVTATSGHTTTATIKGVINTSPANTLLAGHKIRGTIKLGRGLKPVESGGDCNPTSSLKKFPVLSVTLNVI